MRGDVENRRDQRSPAWGARLGRECKDMFGLLTKHMAQEMDDEQTAYVAEGVWGIYGPWGIQDGVSIESAIRSRSFPTLGRCDA